MRIYQSLAEASLYRTVALIPEQAMFGLALAADQTFRSSDEAQKSLTLGKEFCAVFQLLTTEGSGYAPTTSSAATIAAGILELPPADLAKWRTPLGRVQVVIEEVLAGRDTQLEQLSEAIRHLEQFAMFAKQNLPGVVENEHNHLAG